MFRRGRHFRAQMDMKTFFDTLQGSLGLPFWGHCAGLWLPGSIILPQSSVWAGSCNPGMARRIPGGRRYGGRGGGGINGCRTPLPDPPQKHLKRKEERKGKQRRESRRESIIHKKQKESRYGKVEGKASSIGKYQEDGKGKHCHTRRLPCKQGRRIAPPRKQIH